MGFENQHGYQKNIFFCSTDETHTSLEWHWRRVMMMMMAELFIFVWRSVKCKARDWMKECRPNAFVSHSPVNRPATGNPTPLDSCYAVHWLQSALLLSQSAPPANQQHNNNKPSQLTLKPTVSYLDMHISKSLIWSTCLISCWKTCCTTCLLLSDS